VLPLLFGFHAGTTTIVLAAVGGTVISCSLAIGLLAYRGPTAGRLHRQIAVDSIKFGMKATSGDGQPAQLAPRRDDPVAHGLVNVVGYYPGRLKVAGYSACFAGLTSFSDRDRTLFAEEAAVRGARTYRWSFGINMIAVAILAVVAKPLVLRFFGDELAAAVRPYILLIAAARSRRDSGRNVGIGKPELNIRRPIGS
jgi:hypothetical protein